MDVQHLSHMLLGAWTCFIYHLHLSCCPNDVQIHVTDVNDQSPLGYLLFMQQLLDYIAILAFVIVYFISRDIFLATGVLMIGVTLQVCLYWLIKKPIGNELKITFWACMILGGMTLIFRNETFIQFKPSIVNWVLAVVLVVAHLWRGKFVMEKMLGKVLSLPDEAWFILTYAWAAGFIAAGIINLYVAFNYSMDTWVTFKFVGLMGINIVYLIATFGYLGAKGYLTEEHLREPEPDKPPLAATEIAADKGDAR